jgi:Activator of Hsp90 ATPase homolog 1-like protein
MPPDIEQPVSTLQVCKEVQIEAPIAVAFAAMLEQLGPGNSSLQAPMPMKLEPWPGGRWYRDLGNNAGHLWGHVQVIKPPTLLEVTGPLFMSYPAVSHIQYRLVEEGRITRLTLTHRAIGQITPEHREGVGKGWEHMLAGMKARALAKH